MPRCERCARRCGACAPRATTSRRRWPRCRSSSTLTRRPRATCMTPWSAATRSTAALPRAPSATHWRAATMRAATPIPSSSWISVTSTARRRRSRRGSPSRTEAAMPHQSLDEFIAAADAAGEVRYVEGANWDLEVGCLAELSCEMDGPLLLFDGFAGFPRGYRVSTNCVRTPRRFALAMDFPLDAHPVDLARLWRERRQRFQPIAPAVVPDGP